MKKDITELFVFLDDFCKQYECTENSDGSYNSLDNETINVEYIIHPPTNLYTTQARTARLFGDNTMPTIPTMNDNNNNNNDDTDTYSDNSETEHDTDDGNV